MALTFDQAVEEEKKRKLQNLNDITSDTFSNFVNSPTVTQTPSAGKLVGGTARGLRDIASTGASIVGESFKKVGSDIASGYRGDTIKPSVDARDVMPGKNQFGQNQAVQNNTVKIPAIRETPNAQRDSELGKMNVSANGDTVTYDIGGNTLAFNNREKQIRDNLALINKKIASGITVSPSQMARINNIRKQAGLRSLSNTSGIQRVGNMDVQFDASVTPEARKAFLENPVKPTAQMDRYDRRQLAQINKPATVNDPMPIMPTNKTNEAMADYNKAMGEWSNRQILRDQQGIAKDENRIQEMDVTGINKLRDIQGQVEQTPKALEKPEPIVIDEETSDPLDPTRVNKRQRIITQNADGTYVDVTPQQTASFTESQEDIVAKLRKMKAENSPNLAAAEAKYKKYFGALPY